MLRQLETHPVWGCQLGGGPRRCGSSEPDPERLLYWHIPECLVTSGRARGWLS